ncbi:MAG: hypothetical protein ACRBFS_06635 [Aureispira sp.]
MNRLKLKDFKQKNLNKETKLATTKVLDEVFGTGPRRPKECPLVGFTGGSTC